MPSVSDFKSIKETYDGTRSGMPFRSDGSRDFVRKFIVKVFNTSLGADAICQAPGLPLPFSPYVCEDGAEFDLAAVMVEISAVPADPASRKVWIVTCNYSTRVPEGGVPEFTRMGSIFTGTQNNPDLEPPEIDWDFEVVQRAPIRDLDGEAYVTSANQPFIPAPQFEAARNVLVYTRNELDFSRAYASQYNFALNSDTFLGAAPGTAQCLPIRAKRMHRGRLAYWRVTCRIRFGLAKYKESTNKVQGSSNSGLLSATGGLGALAPEPPATELESFQPEILDAGTLEIQKTLGIPWYKHPVPIWRHGVQVSAPVLLDGAGSVSLPDADGKIKPHYRKFRQFQSQPFARLITAGLGGLR